MQSVCGVGPAACHGVLTTGQPVAVVDVNQADTGVPWTVATSHELFEMLVDPFMQTQSPTTDGSGDIWLNEVADPVEDYSYWVRGVQLSDFVYPAWFANVNGPQDWAGQLDDSTAGTGTYEFSCPTGYAQYWDPYMGNTTMSCQYGYMHNRKHTHAVRLRKGRDSHRLRGWHGLVRLRVPGL
jgi:hypothetical protein